MSFPRRHLSTWAAQVAKPSTRHWLGVGLGRAKPRPSSTSSRCPSVKQPYDHQRKGSTRSSGEGLAPAHAPAEQDASPGGYGVAME
jgi:hypothetical protein